MIPLSIENSVAPEVKIVNDPSQHPIHVGSVIVMELKSNESGCEMASY